MAPGWEANIANSGKSIDLLHNNCILNVHVYSIQFHNEMKASLNICFLDLSEEFRRGSKPSSN